MNSEEKYEYWLKKATDDFIGADALFEKRLWSLAAFYCHQAIEKLVKGLYTFYIDDGYPRTHNIVVIANKIEDKLSITISEEHYEFFRDLSHYYLNTRYEDYKLIIYKSLNKQNTKLVLEKTREAFTWLLTLK
jgi:HEPN domain-containing protein